MSTIAQRFATFARVYPELPLYRRLCEAAADDPEVCSLLEVARAGQARPVLLLAAVHDLVLRRPDLELARWYSSVTPVGELATHDPWPTFRRTCLEHRAELEGLVATRTTQTNEVNRAVLVAVLAAAACADRPEQPVSLVELGASAGLLSGVDRYRVRVGGTELGDPTSRVHTAAGLRGPRTPEVGTFPTRIDERVGIDLSPVHLDDPEGIRWLEACLWPDEPWRIERFRAAVAQSCPDPPRLVTGDMVTALPEVAAATDPDNHLVVFDVWALTYVARPRRVGIPQALARIAASGRPVSWLTAEPPGAVPGITPPAVTDGIEEASADTVLGLRRWRSGRELPPRTLGWAHPHGNWVYLTD